MKKHSQSYGKLQYIVEKLGLSSSDVQFLIATPDELTIDPDEENPTSAG